MKKLLFNLFCIFFFFAGIYYAYDSYYIVRNNKVPVVAPNFLNMDYDEVIKSAKDLDLNVELVAKEYSNYSENKVYLQIPESGKIIKNSSVIKVAVSKGPYKINLKDLKGLDLDFVKNEINALNLNVKNISYIKHKHPFNTIIAVYPDNNEVLYRKKQISLLVSYGLGDKIVIMPNLIGLDYKTAVRILNSNELINTEPRYVESKWFPPDSVVQQNYPANKNLKSGTFIDITITKKQ